MRVQSCLSENVRKMICEVGICGEVDDILTAELIIDTGRLKQIFDSCHLCAGGVGTQTWYGKVLRFLAPAIHYICDVYSELPADGFRKKAALLLWTGAVEDIEDCFQSLHKADPVLAVLAVLRITAILEHSLGNVLFGKGVQVPFLLKDILSAPQLCEVFGLELMTLLQVIVGPPQSLNLRNVAWHGFIRPEELDKRYAYLLICILLSLGQQLSGGSCGGVSADDWPRCRRFSLEKSTSLLCDFDGLDFDRGEFLSKLEHSQVVLPGRMAYWLMCADLFDKALYAECLTLALPQLECMLRVLYTNVNNCSHRLLTAEMSTLYTTLDEVLAKETELGSPNSVRTALGESNFEMLLDIFSYLEGPRLRDRLSHGEVDLKTVDKKLVRHILHLVTVVACISDSNDTISSIQNDYVKALMAVSSSYQAHFHPSQTLKANVLRAVGKLGQLAVNLERKDDSIVEESTSDEMDACIFLLGKKCDIGLERDGDSSLLRDLKLLEKFARDCAPVTLFRPRKELAVVTLLRLVCDETCIILDQLNATLTSRAQDWDAGRLRSRQRSNYKRLLQSVPVLYDGVALAIWIVVSIFRGINDIEALDSTQSEKVLRILKMVLKFAENLHSQTSPTQNRWDESCKLCLACSASVYQYLKNDSTTLFLSLRQPCL
ncbi:endoplasmic reticulum membrane-associated RNA degradation protein-like isoform X2 [Haemaphysalis longicornis]